MLLNLNKKSWMDSLHVRNYTEHSKDNQESMGGVLKLAQAYKKVFIDFF